MNDLTEKFLAFLGVIAALVLSTIWGGYVLSLLWAWFIASTFSAPVLTITQAIGVRLVVGFMTMNSKTSDKDRAFGESIALAFFLPLFGLLLGLLVKQWLPS